MNIEIDRTDLMNMIKGTNPTYELMEHPMIKLLGSFTGGFSESWNWNYSFSSEFSNVDLLEVYTLLKNKERRF